MSGLHSASSLQTTGKPPPIELGHERDQVARLPAESQAVDDVEDGVRRTSAHTS